MMSDVDDVFPMVWKDIYVPNLLKIHDKNPELFNFTKTKDENESKFIRSMNYMN
jgi:hypothetical protein